MNLVFAYPGDLDLLTGGYAYDRRLIVGLRDLGWQVELLPLGDGFPFPTPEVKARAEQRLSALPHDTLLMIDGLAFGVLDEWSMTSHARIVALVHHPLALEGHDAETGAKLRASETMALKAARHVIVTSPQTAQGLTAGFGVAASRITTAVPGTDRAAMAKGDNDPPHILSVGTMIRRKGHDVLLSALEMVADLPWRATILGSQTLDPATAQAIAQQAAGLGDRVTLLGQTPDVRQMMATADIFALASRYEGYGMVFAEAMSQGLPVIACHAGAVPDVVPDTAGILTPPDDVDAFAAALRRLLTDDALRRSLAKGAAEAGAALPDWAETARLVAGVLKT